MAQPRSGLATEMRKFCMAQKQQGEPADRKLPIDCAALFTYQGTKRRTMAPDGLPPGSGWDTRPCCRERRGRTKFPWAGKTR